MSCWHPLPQVTLFGAWGPIERGYDRLASTFAWVGSRFSGGALLAEDVEMFSSGDLAYTIGFERGLVSIDGAPGKIMKIRVTHLYRRIDRRWALVHRHADFPPSDPRSASSG
jgi:ketosteroid isomerase-like protein